MDAIILARLAAARQGARPGGGHGTAADGAGGASADVLDVIEEAETAGRPATVTSVAAALGIDQPRASKLVAGAVAAGLVRREADQADGRRAMLVRTPAGQRLSAQAHAFGGRSSARPWPTGQPRTAPSSPGCLAGSWNPGHSDPLKISQAA